MFKRVFYTSLLSTLLAFSQTQQRSTTLTWNDNINPVGTTFNIYRSASACSVTTSTFTKLNVNPVTTKTYTDTTVTTGQSYCYRVTAVNNNLESLPSNTADAPITPLAPSSLTVTIQITVTTP